MEKPYILAYGRVSEEALKKLGHEYETVYFANGENLENERFRAVLQQAQAIVGVELEVNEELLDHAPELKVVSNVAVGYDNLNVTALSKRGIAACHTPGVLNDTVADAVFGMVLASARRIPEMDRFVKEKKWNGVMPDEKFGVDVHHKKIGIIGMGRIGEAIAKRAALGFDMEVLYHTRSRKEKAEDEYGAVYQELPDLLEQSDFVVLMTPLTPDTEGLMGTEEFRRMKAGSIFINASRGAVVDEEALVHALRSGEIRGAALDVFQQEPIQPDHPFLTMEQVITLPHLGSATTENENNMSLLAADNALQVLKGQKPAYMINQEIWKGRNKHE
ncbi:gluconate 2-dehydrogenase [Sinobaca qinghaiensis]|uniref:Glyoxylate/hydroxypyruvate reductase B n=1 Tax=Sinobaca qinghaiensis TaxID=342944 RepID=A0A419V868_9BACL|nr:D-glycerate dehydrogenase [Sinobaca qinghaiensis]RKD76119.1 gluconate 2-dehydrogenase [Sinobaca qinghaiensis]